MINKAPVELDYLESLLPWYSTRKLAHDDILLVERALSEVPELTQHYELVLQEQEATIVLNNSLGAPSPRAFDRLTALLDSRQATKVGAGVVGKRWTGFSSFLGLRVIACVAVLIAIAEAALLAVTFLEPPRKGIYWTVSASRKSAEGDGSFLLISFSPDATVAQIQQFLQAHKASITEGPGAGGIFRVRVSDKALTSEELGALVSFLRTESSIIRFVAPTN